MSTRRITIFTAPAAISLLSALSLFCPALAGQKPAPVEPRHVVARGQFTGTNEHQRIVTWQTANPPGGTLPYARAHLVIESAGSRPHVLFQVDGGDNQYLVDSIRTVAVEPNSPPAILSLWWEGASAGAVLRAFRWDPAAHSFVELRSGDDLSGVRRYSIKESRPPQIVLTRSTVSEKADFSLERITYTVRGLELVRAEGGDAVKPAGESGITGETVISPTRPGPVRVGDTETTAPFPAELIIISAQSGAEVTRLKTGADGRFRVVLPPGQYRVVATPERPGRIFPRGSEETVEVAAGQFAHITIQFDTGIR